MDVKPACYPDNSAFIFESARRSVAPYHLRGDRTAEAFFRQ